MKQTITIALLFLSSLGMAQNKIKYSSDTTAKFMPIVLQGIKSAKPTDTLFNQSGNRVFKEVTTVYDLGDKKPYTIKYKTVWNDIKGFWDFYSMQVLTEIEKGYSTTGIFSNQLYLGR